MTMTMMRIFWQKAALRPINMMMIMMTTMMIMMAMIMMTMMRVFLQKAALRPINMSRTCQWLKTLTFAFAPTQMEKHCSNRNN